MNVVRQYRNAISDRLALARFSKSVLFVGTSRTTSCALDVSCFAYNILHTNSRNMLSTYSLGWAMRPMPWLKASCGESSTKLDQLGARSICLMIWCSRCSRRSLTFAGTFSNQIEAVLGWSKLCCNAKRSSLYPCLYGLKTCSQWHRDWRFTYCRNWPDCFCFESQWCTDCYRRISLYLLLYKTCLLFLRKLVR